MKDYINNPELRAAILDKLQSTLPDGKKVSKLRSMIVGSHGRALTFDQTAALPAPGDTGQESISAQEEMRMACAWLMSLSEDDAAGALSVIRTLREGWTL